MLRTLALSALSACALTLAAEDFGPAVKAATQIYQGRTHYGVVCDYRASVRQVADLQRALPEGTTLTVVDLHTPNNVNGAASVLVLRGVELMALVPGDPLVRDGSFYATVLVNQVQRKNIPAFGTTSAALQNGCSFALGSGTGWELMVNPKFLDPSIIGTIGPVEITREPAGTPKGPAQLERVPLN